MGLDTIQKNLYDDIFRLVEEARTFVANTANKTITIMFWKIGERINSVLLDNQIANTENKLCRRWRHN